MENASKALIIAGAILISIVLIAIGVLIVNSANNITDIARDKMSNQEIQIFNADFEKYEGTAVSGSEVKTLLSLINANNANGKDTGGALVSVWADSALISNATAENSYITDTDVVTYSNSGIKNGKRYTITFNRDKRSCINAVKIEANDTNN